MSPYSVQYPTDNSDLLPVVSSSAPRVLESAISRLPRMRAWMFSAVTPGGAPPSAPRSDIVERVHQRLDGQRHRLDPEIRRERVRIVDAAAAGVRRRHQHAEDAIGAERVGRDRRGQRGVDAAGQAEDHAREAALARVVARAERQRAPDLGFDVEIVRGRERSRRRDIADHDVAVERAAARDDGAVGAEHAASPVEDEIVIAAELVHVRDRQTMFQRHAAEHLLAPAMFAGGERRCRHVQDHADAGGRELIDRIVMVAAPLPEVAIVPDVLADADPDPRAGDVEELRAVVRLEVAVLVEDVVGGQQGFPESLIDAAVAQQHGAVEQGPSFVRRIRFRQTDEHRREIGRVARQRLERLPAPLHETPAQEQVSREVADERELGRGGEIGAGRGGGPERVENQPRVAREIADGRVHLQQRDLHAGPEGASARPLGSIVVRSFVTGLFDRTTR